jgi:membrane-bound lytic murein transglycosylase C
MIADYPQRSHKPMSTQWDTEIPRTLPISLARLTMRPALHGVKWPRLRDLAMGTKEEESDKHTVENAMHNSEEASFMGYGLRPSPLAGVLLFLLAGCQTLDKTLDTADSALHSVNTGTMKDIAGIVTAKDPDAALKAEAKRRGEHYKNNPEDLIDDIRAAKRDFEQLMAFLQGNVTKTWGNKEVTVPTKTKYVKYTQSYKSRAVVDFDKGEVVVETLDDKDPSASLRSAIITTLLTPEDPRSVDLFSDKPITLSSDREPYLKGLVLDANGQAISTPQAAEAYANYLMGKGAKTRDVATDGATHRATYVQFAMVSNLENKQRQKFADLVQRYAARYDISTSLVYAIIRTESNFNPYAVSPAPAYGLMQLVPTSGGREAHRKVKGEDGIPDKNFLFDPNNNIEFGTALLNVLTYSQLAAVQSTVSREYCVISAYNTGTGNVLKAFSKDRSQAFDAINTVQPAAVYDKLRRDLPYAETRDYLQKVVSFRKQFVTAEK